MLKRLTIFLAAFFCFNLFFCTAQITAELYFTHINTANGMSANPVRSVYQDRRGFIWICTTDGLNRYDGGRFKVYKQIPGNQNSLPGNDIWDIAEDSKGNFWVGTQTGLSYFEPGENRFTNYLHQPGNKNSLAYVRAENLLVDEEDNLWVGSHNGLQKFNPVTKKFQLIEFATKEELAKDVNYGAIYYLYEDAAKQLWVLAGCRLFTVNKKTLAVQLKTNCGDNNTGVTSVFQDKSGQYWLTYWGNGIAKYDGIHLPGKNDFICTKGIYARVASWVDIRGEEWIVATATDGLIFFNKEGKVFLFNNDYTKPNSFGAHGGAEIITDKQNNIWIATQKGLELIEPSKQFFNYHYLGEKKDREDYYKFGTPQPLLKTGNKYWAGLWHANGLLLLDSNFKTIKHYPSIPVKTKDLNDRTINYIEKNADGTYWVTTSNGLVHCNFEKEYFEKFLPADIKPDAFEFGTIISKGKKLYVRSRHYGLYVFNTVTHSFEKHFTATNSKLPGNDVNDITTDKNGTIWIATSAGIALLHTNADTITEQYKAISGKKETDDYCRTIDTDSKNNLWIGTQNGLIKFNSSTKIFEVYTTTQGLSNNTINNLVTDNHDNVWMITGNGVSVFKQKEKRFQNFYKEDGLPENTPDGKIYKDEDGIIYITHFGIVLSINPDETPVNNIKPPVLITDAGNLQANVSLNSKGEKQLITGYKNNSVEINFAVLNYTAPYLNKYFYRLQGIDNGWHSSDRGTATYNSLPPGNYTLYVKGSNNSGVMNEEGDFIHITVMPAWYQAWWFKTLLWLFVVAVVFYLVRRRISSIRAQALLKQKIAETEMQALRAQMNPHFIFNSLNSIENFIMQNEKRLASDYLNKFSKLVRSILDSSRNEIVPVAKDMETLKLYVELEQLRFNNKFNYYNYTDPQLINGDYKVPSLLIQPYVENAIVHGIGHSDNEGLQLTVTATLENDKIKYTIQDNGIGRKLAAEYRLQNKPGHKSVGLTITADRIAHFNNQQSGSSSVQITDLYNDGKPAGTKVQIFLNSN